MSELMEQSGSALEDAILAAQLFIVDPQNIAVRALPGPVRDSWVEKLQHIQPWVKVPVSASLEALLGGIDFAATVATGTIVSGTGLIARARGGCLILSMAERLEPLTISIVTEAQESGFSTLERELAEDTVKSGVAGYPGFAFVALDEGLDETETLTPALLDRVAYFVDLSAIHYRAIEELSFDYVALERVREQLVKVQCPESVLEDICQLTLDLRIDSIRPALATLRAARVVAALEEDTVVNASHLARALRMTILPRVNLSSPSEADAEQQQENAAEEQAQQTQEQPPPEQAEQETPDQEPEQQQNSNAGEAEETIADSSAALLPPDILQLLKSEMERRQLTQSGRGKVYRKSKKRGRPLGTVPGEPGAGVRLNILATLRAALPWQKIRSLSEQSANAAKGITRNAGQIKIRRSDFRVNRYKQSSAITTIFVVDASGSAAANRLAETKGAIELMLAECYVRRDEVAMIAFRRQTAELVLPPTRSLARAKRMLTRLPAGGGTPLATAIDSALTTAESVVRDGVVPHVVFMTDGRPNVGLDGLGGAKSAMRDAFAAAHRFRTLNVASLVIDTATRPRQECAQLAAAMGAIYRALPQLGARSVADTVQSAQTEMRAARSAA